jgi:sterol-4alpha-carboxylate 3-dehydrogenase (decarboxylating)
MQQGKESSSALLGTVLVTGGCGFVGSFITQAFASDPSCSRVVVVSRNPNKNRISEAEYLSCDILDTQQAKKLLDEIQPRVIVHTVSPGPFAPAPAHYHVSYVGTKQLLKLAKEHSSVRAFVWTSSMCSVHLDPKQNHRPLDEADAKPNNWKSACSPYSRSKGATESLVLGSTTDATIVDFSNDANWRDKILTTSIRITGLYGPRDKVTIGEMLNTNNTVASRFQVGPNELVHSWCYVETGANAHVDAAKALLDGKHLRPDDRVDGEAFFISDPTPMRFWTFTSKVKKAGGDAYYNKPQEQQKPIIIPFWFMFTLAWLGEWAYWIVTLNTRTPAMTTFHFEDMSRGCNFSIEKARKRLGWRPVVDTEEGIQRSVKWFQENQNCREILK